MILLSTLRCLLRRILVQVICIYTYILVYSSCSNIIGLSGDDSTIELQRMNCLTVPQYIIVNYLRKGENKGLTDVEAKVFDWISDNFIIPADIDTNHKYGPHR